MLFYLYIYFRFSFSPFSIFSVIFAYHLLKYIFKEPIIVHTYIFNDYIYITFNARAAATTISWKIFFDLYFSLIYFRILNLANAHTPRDEGDKHKVIDQRGDNCHRNSLLSPHIPRYRVSKRQRISQPTREASDHPVMQNLLRTLYTNRVVLLSLARVSSEGVIHLVAKNYN